MSAIIDALLSGVGFVGNVLDTPGALVRNTLSGRNPFAGLNPFDPEGRASGRDMLQSWGILDDNQEGLDWGDVAGFGAELVTDPLNLLGAGAAKNTARLAKEARAANALSDARVAAGWMPADVAKATFALDDSGNPLRMMHGSTKAFDDFDLSKVPTTTEPIRGHYFSTNPDIANAYTRDGTPARFLADEESPNVSMRFLDVRSPFFPETQLPREHGESLIRKAMLDVPSPSATGATGIGPGQWPFSDFGVDDFPAASGNMSGMEFLGRLFEGGAVPSAGPSAGVTGSDLAVQRLKSLGYDGINASHDLDFQPVADTWVAFDKSQIYKPWVAGEQQTIPSQLPLLAALMGHNSLARGSQF